MSAPREENVTSWVITVPKTIQWEEYKKELKAVEDGDSVLNYKVRGFPAEMEVGDRCYVVWNGQVRGWMPITGLIRRIDYWKCGTTGKIWTPGCYIQRSGLFMEVEGPEMIGFRGVRRLVTA